MARDESGARTRRTFTDIFIKHPVLAVVVNLVIVLVGWRALTTLPVQQYPKIESSSVIITTVYYGASAETVRGFLTTPIERVVSAISGGVGHLGRLLRDTAVSSPRSEPAGPAGDGNAPRGTKAGMGEHTDDALSYYRAVSDHVRLTILASAVEP